MQNTESVTIENIMRAHAQVMIDYTDAVVLTTQRNSPEVQIEAMFAGRALAEQITKLVALLAAGTVGLKQAVANHPDIADDKLFTPFDLNI